VKHVNITLFGIATLLRWDIFLLAKGKYGRGMLYTRLEETTMSGVALSILLMNLNKILFYRKLLACFLLSRFVAARKFRAAQ
jgi:hypothetical protein